MVRAGRRSGHDGGRRQPGSGSSRSAASAALAACLVGGALIAASPPASHAGPAPGQGASPATGAAAAPAEGDVEEPGETPLEQRLFPDRTYDPSVPSPSEHLGYGPGHYHTDYLRLTGYLEELARSSDRVRVETYGLSYELRPLYAVIVASPDRLARLDEIRADHARLAHPADLTDDEAGSILERAPAVVMLNYGTHGNETSAFEASFHTAYQLAAATDEATREMLDELVVVITPALSPDGHERFVTWYNANQAGAAGDPRSGDADPAAAEHFAPWGVDTNNNHYQINPNRESAWNTQRESRRLVELYMDWNPQVFVDHHGNPEEFIGPWNVEPLNPRFAAAQLDWMGRFGREMAALFRDHGYRYTPWEFGIMYPGYWDAFPLFNGAVAFTLESGGGGWKGLRSRLPGGALTTFEDGVVQNIVADQSVLRTTALHRREILSDYLDTKRSAIREGREHPVRAYLLSADNDPRRLKTVVDLLVRDDVEVRRTLEDLRVPAGAARPHFESRVPEAPEPPEAGRGADDPRSFPAGSYLVPMAQPQSRLLRALMDPDTEFPPEYLEEVAERRRLAERPGFVNPNIWATTEPFYDVTAWSLPLTYHLEAYALEAAPEVATERVEGPLRLEGRLARPEAGHAWAFDASSNGAIAAIAHLRRRGIPFAVATEPFRAAGHRFDRGSIVVFRQDFEDVLAAGSAAAGPSSPPPAIRPSLLGDGTAEERLREIMAGLAEETGVTVHGLDDNLTEEGPALGSDRFLDVVPGKIAVVRGGPIRPSSYGAIWFLCERVHGVEFTALDFDRLTTVDLEAYDVLVLPDGFYTDLAPGLEATLAGKLRHWVRRGGSLVALKGAAAWVAEPRMGLTSVRTLAPYEGKSIYMTDGGHAPVPVAGPPAEPEVGGSGGARESGSGAAEEGDGPGTPEVRETPMIHGAILRARTEPHHWLAHGYRGEIPVTVWSNLVLRVPAGGDVAAPVYFVEADRLLVAGFAFDDSLEHLAGSGYLLDEPRGLGHVILYADDPNFRLYWDGLSRLFFNSLLFSGTF